MSDKPKKIELSPAIMEELRNNPDSIFAERVRLEIAYRQTRANVLKAFEGTFLYPIVKWWLK